MASIYSIQQSAFYTTAPYSHCSDSTFKPRTFYLLTCITQSHSYFLPPVLLLGWHKLKIVRGVLKLKLPHRGSWEKSQEILSGVLFFFPWLLFAGVISVHQKQNFLWEWTTPFKLHTKHLLKVKGTIAHSESSYSHPAQRSYLEHPIVNGSSAYFRVGT